MPMNPLSDCATRLALDLFGRVKTELASGRLTKRKLVWLELTGCSGNIISQMNAEFPDFAAMLTEMVDLVYSNTLSVNEDGPAMDQLFSVLGGDFLLAVEGAVATGAQGQYTIIGRYSGQRITGMDANRIFGSRAAMVIAVGTCASDGGISAASPNPTGCVGIQDLLERPVIRVPGCPCNPAWFMATLGYILLYGIPPLDAFNRPLMIYGTTIHDVCQRRSFYDSGIFASHLGEESCMYMLGCRGPITQTDCPIRRWNQRINWPVQDSTPCIGCAQFGFPDRMEPFLNYSAARENQG